MKQQLVLFEKPKIKTDDLKELASKNPSKCFNELRKRGYQLPNSIWFVLSKNLETDWGVL